MILVFIFILFYSLSRYYDLSDYGLSSGFRYWQLIAYNFIHLTFMHMFFNSIGYLIYKPVIAEYYGRKAPIIVIPISVILSSAIFCSEKPTFGASTIIFSMARWTFEATEIYNHAAYNVNNAVNIRL